MAHAQRRVALVIGASRYAAVGSLNNATRDAQLVANAISKTGFSDVITIENPTRDQLMSGLRDFAERSDSADVAFIYYAGHGLELDGTNWLLPVDARLKSDRDLEFEGVRLESLLSAIKGARTRIIALDACRDNPFVPAMRRVSSTRAITRGLGRVEVDDVLLIYAAEAGATAADGAGTNGPFARALDRWLPEPGLDIRLMAGKVRDQVLRETNGSQRPYVSASLPGEIVTLSAARARPYLGILHNDVDAYWKSTLVLESTRGIVVAGVYPGSPAGIAGLREADVIVGLGTANVGNSASFVSLLASAPVGKPVDLKIIRHGVPITLQAVLTARPSDEAIAAWNRRLHEMAEAPPELASAIREDLNRGQPDSLLWSAASTITTKLLPFYPGFRLVDITQTRMTAVRRARFVYRSPSVVRLDFTSAPMNSLSARHLTLKADLVPDFFRFFTDNLIAEDGRFRIVERPADFVWRSTPSPALLQQVNAALLPMTAASVTQLPDGGYRARVSMLYGSMLLHAILEVTPRGAVSMTNDTIVVRNLPVLIETW